MSPVLVNPFRFGGGGGGGGGTLTYRGATTVTIDSGTTVTCALPAGTVAGDVALFYAEHGYGISTAPSGWSSLAANTLYGDAWLWKKTLTSADITAGSVSAVFGGSWWGAGVLVTVGGAATATLAGQDHQGNSNTGTEAVTYSPGTDEDLFWFAGTRAGNAVASDIAIDAGTSIGHGQASQYISVRATHQSAPVSSPETVNATASGDSFYARTELFGVAVAP